jgi:hypothetical protein
MLIQKIILGIALLGVIVMIINELRDLWRGY